MAKMLPLTKCITQSQTIRGVKMDPKPFFNCIQGVSCCVQGGFNLSDPLDKYSPVDKKSTTNGSNVQSVGRY